MTGLVEVVQEVRERVGDCWRVKAAELVGQARMKVLVPVRKIRMDGGVTGAAGLKAASCKSHAPELRLAVALKEPAELAI